MRTSIVEHIRESLFVTPFDTAWVPYSTRFVLMGGTPRDLGAFSVYKMYEGKLENLISYEHSKPIKCGTFNASTNERHIAFADTGGQLLLVDPECPSKSLFNVPAHNGIIHAIAGCGPVTAHGASEAVTAGADGTAKVWDFRQTDGPVVDITPNQDSQKRECWGVSFGGATSAFDRIMACGYDNGDVKVVDLRMGGILWQTNVGGGAVNLEFDSLNKEKNKLVVTNLDGFVNVYDLKTHSEEKGFAFVKKKVHNGTVWRARHLPSSRDVFASTGGTGEVKLWRYRYPKERTVIDANSKKEEGVAGKVELITEQTISSQPVCSFDWHPNKPGLAVCSSFDQSVSVLYVTNLN
ncbi:hypothetical protein P9112_005909 [Eukaryota sp. TZLM1-RC]